MEGNLMIQCENLCKSYGGIVAVDRVSISASPNETVGIIGSNGAGKTTLFNLLTGFDRPTSGQIYLMRGGGKILLNRLPPYRRAKEGVGRTFQNPRLFGNLTVEGNIQAGALGAHQRNVDYEALLNELGLWEKRELTAESLPYGDQKRVELARTLAAGAKVLLLDEPAAGLNETETAALADLLVGVRQHRLLTIILIEHNMDFIQHLCKRVYAMDLGKIISTGTPKEVLESPQVIDAIFGGKRFDAG